MNSFAIRTPRLGYHVHSFSAKRQAVILTPDVTTAKRFATRAKAQAWLDGHSGRGYGLSEAFVVDLAFNPADVVFA